MCDFAFESLLFGQRSLLVGCGSLLRHLLVTVIRSCSALVPLVIRMRHVCLALRVALRRLSSGTEPKALADRRIPDTK